jgi:hypothetical protein
LDEKKSGFSPEYRFAFHLTNIPAVSFAERPSSITIETNGRFFPKKGPGREV